jgi:hypothetical protein
MDPADVDEKIILFTALISSMAGGARVLPQEPQKKSPKSAHCRTVVLAKESTDISPLHPVLTILR